MSKIFTFEALHFETLITPLELKQELKASPTQLEFIQETRRAITRILNGKDDRLLLVVGPCSIHDLAAAKEYATKLQQLGETVSKQFLIVMRTYFEKPRTILGWKGMLCDPHLNGKYDFASGLRLARQLLLELANMSIATATEFLDPASSRYFGDLISWGCIGARTAESQIHRQLASGLPMPIAFKNSTSGSIEVAVNGVLAASAPHAFMGIDDLGRNAVIHTRGNPHAHIALRGGESQPNYDPQSINHAIETLKKWHLPQRIIVDCSHDNSRRKHEIQRQVFSSVIEQFTQGNQAIRGLILESHLFAGNQELSVTDHSRLQYAVSLTDSCLDWNSTEELILWGADMLKQRTAIEPVQQSVCAK